VEDFTIEQVIDGFRYSPLSMEERGQAFAAYLNSRAARQNASAFENGRLMRVHITLGKMSGTVAHIVQSTLIDSIDEAGFLHSQQDVHEVVIDLGP
jgi:hypothetical protein